MSLDSNLYEKSIKILTDLISFKTISGKDNGPLIAFIGDNKTPIALIPHKEKSYKHLLNE